MVKNVLEKCDIIYVDCAPQAGHEQNGRRPALVVSNCIFNKHERNMAFVCPITSTNRNSPFHVKFPEGKCKTTGYVMADQIKSLDINARNAQLYDVAPDEVVDEVLEIIRDILE